MLYHFTFILQLMYIKYILCIQTYVASLQRQSNNCERDGKRESLRKRERSGVKNDHTHGAKIGMSFCKRRQH